MSTAHATPGSWEGGRKPMQTRDLAEFVRSTDPDLLRKTTEFAAYVGTLREAGFYQRVYRVELLGPLDHRITVRDPFTGEPREMVCLDSNSYLGLHLHPKVRQAVHAAIDDVGIGTPSAQVLSGYNRYLAALEERLSALHRRESCLIFPSGYQANVGSMTGLLRPGDLVLLDGYCHASLQDGCRYSGAEVTRFHHSRLDEAEAILAARRDLAHSALIATDGVFSMHGDVADLPRLLALARRHRARLYVDDAHGLGVLGPQGRGIEEEFACEGAVDVLMGTFSKATGAAGGYVCGDRALTDYLRFFASGALFTASLPAPVCAGVEAALAVMADEPWHRERLWANTRWLSTALRDAGLCVPERVTPIVPVAVGAEDLLPPLAIGLYRAGIKVGLVQYPAVPHGHAALRLTVNARHDEADLARVVEVLAELAHRFPLPRPA